MSGKAFQAYPYERVRTISSGICYRATLALLYSLLWRTLVLPKVRGVRNPEQSRCITAFSILVGGPECFYTAVQVLKFRSRFELRVWKSYRSSAILFVGWIQCAHNWAENVLGIVQVPVHLVPVERGILECTIAFILHFLTASH